MEELLKAIYETVTDENISSERKVEIIKAYYEVAEDNHAKEPVQ